MTSVNMLEGVVCGRAKSYPKLTLFCDGSMTRTSIWEQHETFAPAVL
jgi:hypothetical protein